MSNRLGGKQGTAYIGTNANQPPNWSFVDRDPTQYDFNNYSLGDLWMNTTTQKVWVLVSLQGNSMSAGMLAKWITWGSGLSTGNLVSLTGNTVTGTNPIYGDANQNINVLGDTSTITVDGNSSTNTLTLSISSNFYVTGTWTPVLSFGGGSTGITYSTQVATFTKIGNLVWVDANITLTSKGSDSGLAVISGLPYTVNNAILRDQDGIFNTNGSSIALDGGNTMRWAAFIGGSTTLVFTEGTPAGAYANLNDTNFTDSAAFTVQGVYQTS